jgi:hypothetical protein
MFTAEDRETWVSVGIDQQRLVLADRPLAPAQSPRCLQSVDPIPSFPLQSAPRIEATALAVGHRLRRMERGSASNSYRESQTACWICSLIPRSTRSNLPLLRMCMFLETMAGDQPSASHRSIQGRRLRSFLRIVARIEVSWNESKAAENCVRAPSKCECVRAKYPTPDWNHTIPGVLVNILNDAKQV